MKCEGCDDVYCFVCIPYGSRGKMNNDKLEAEWKLQAQDEIGHDPYDNSAFNNCFIAGYVSGKKSSQAEIDKLSSDLRYFKDLYKIAKDECLQNRQEIQKLTLQLKKAEEVITIARKIILFVDNKYFEDHEAFIDGIDDYFKNKDKV